MKLVLALNLVIQQMQSEFEIELFFQVLISPMLAGGNLQQGQLVTSRIVRLVLVTKLFQARVLRN
jgi:hypothetical protein